MIHRHDQGWTSIDEHRGTRWRALALWAACCWSFLAAGVTGQTPDPATLPSVPGLEQDSPLRDGLRNAAAKFTRERTGLVAYLGGSITHNPGWTQLVDEELQRRFPDTQFTFVHAGIPSVDSTGHALRIRDFLVNGPPLNLPPLADVSVKSSMDGTMQPSRLWAPATADSEPTPLLVYLHSWSSDYRQDNSAWQREAVRRGWIYLHPNFRGVNRTPEACGSRLARQDILDALDHVRTKYQVDPARIYLAGTSGGGHMAMLMGAHHPDRFSAVSAWVGIADLADWYRFHVKDGKLDHYAQMTADALGGAPGHSPEVDAQYRERSPLYSLERAVGLPLDIAAGVTDGHSGSVPIAHSLRAFNAIARASGKEPVTDEEMDELWKNGKLARPRPDDTPNDPTYGRAILLRRTADAARVTIFEGGHEGLPAAGCEWLAKQRRRAPR